MAIVLVSVRRYRWTPIFALFLSLLAPAPVAADRPSREVPQLSADVRNLPLLDFLRIIAEVENMNVAVAGSADAAFQLVSLHVEREPITDLLAKTLPKLGLEQRIVGIVHLICEKGDVRCRNEPPKDYSKEIISIDAWSLTFSEIAAALELATGRHVDTPAGPAGKRRYTVRFIDTPWDQIVELLAKGEIQTSHGALNEADLRLARGVMYSMSRDSPPRQQRALFYSDRWIVDSAFNQTGKSEYAGPETDFPPRASLRLQFRSRGAARVSVSKPGSSDLPRHFVWDDDQSRWLQVTAGLSASSDSLPVRDDDIVTLNLDRIRPGDFFQIASEITGLNHVGMSPIDSLISLRLFSVSWKEGVAEVFKRAKLVTRRIGDTIFVATSPEPFARLDSRTFALPRVSLDSCRLSAAEIVRGLEALHLGPLPPLQADAADRVVSLRLESIPADQAVAVLNARPESNEMFRGWCVNSPAGRIDGVLHAIDPASGNRVFLRHAAGEWRSLENLTRQALCRDHPSDGCRTAEPGEFFTTFQEKRPVLGGTGSLYLYRSPDKSSQIEWTWSEKYEAWLRTDR